MLRNRYAEGNCVRSPVSAVGCLLSGRRSGASDTIWSRMLLKESLLWFCLALALPPVVRAAEIDSITDRNHELRNSMRALNAMLNGFLREGVERANERKKDCDEKTLYKSLRKAIVSPFIGHALAERLNQDEGLDSRRVPLEESIYQDLGLFDAISVHIKDLSAVIRLDDHLVGVDKLGHFLVEGWKYFEIAYLDGEGVETAVHWGQRAERTYFGLRTTGIFSYADLAANFDGMRFWARLLGHQKDPLDKGFFFNRSYVKCSKHLWSRKPYWRLRRRVDLGDFVNGAWDEGMNCHLYKDEEIAAAIRRRVEETEKIDGKSYTCPIEPSKCAVARERYDLYAHTLLHPLCLEAEEKKEERSFFDLFR